MASPLTVISGVTTVFQNVDAYAGDPILSLMEAFNRIPGQTVNLSIGLYYNEQAIIPSWRRSVRPLTGCSSQQQKAAALIRRWRLAPYRRAVQTLLFGDNHPALRAGRTPPSRHWGLAR